jgi:hypothetical protein
MKRRDSLVQDSFIGLDDEFYPIVHRLQMAISDNDCDLDNLVLEGIESSHFAVDLGIRSSQHLQ